MSLNINGSKKLQRWYLGIAAGIGIMFTAALFSPAPADQGISETLQVDSDSLILNGQGTRKKAFISLYDAGLYLSSPASDANEIVAADSPMAIRLIIVSRFISAKKMTKAMLEGFNQSTGGNMDPIQNEIAEFQKAFSEAISKQDVFDLLYRPTVGVEVLKNGVSKNTIVGLPFKQALFGIWLSDDPVQQSLKQAMLAAK